MGDTLRLNPNQNPMFVPDGGGGGSGVGAVLVWQQPTTMAEILAQVPSLASGQGAVVYMIDDGAGFAWDVDAVSLDNVTFIGMNGIANLNVDPGGDLSAGTSLHLRNVNLIGFSTISPPGDFFLDMEFGSISPSSNPLYSSPLATAAGSNFVARLIGVDVEGATGEGGFRPGITLGDGSTSVVWTGGQTSFGSHAFGLNGVSASLFYVVDSTCPVPDSAAFAVGITLTPTRLGVQIDQVTPLQTNNYTAQPGEFVQCDASSGGFNVTLPTAAAAGANAVITIKSKVLTVNAVTVVLSGGDTSDSDVGSFVLAAYETVRLISDGTSDWMKG